MKPKHPALMRRYTAAPCPVPRCWLSLAMPGPAAADHTDHGHRFQPLPASPVAGASVNASSSTSLIYPGVGNTDDVKTTIGHFAPGLSRTRRPSRTARRPCTSPTHARPIPGSASRGRRPRASAGRPGRHRAGADLQPGAARRRGRAAGNHRGHHTDEDVPDRALLRPQHGRLRARRSPRRPSAHDRRDRRHPDPAVELHPLRNGRRPQLHARPDLVLAEGLHRRGIRLRPPGLGLGTERLLYPDQLCGAPLQADVRDGRRLAGDDRGTPAPSDDRKGHPAAR